MSTTQAPVHTGIHHIKLPVTDLERSTQWYSDVLGARRLTELDHRRPDGTLFAVILDVPQIAGKVELRLAPETAGVLDGYDFLTLAIEDKDALDRWTAHLDALGIHHSPPIVAMVGWLLVVTDPDGLRLRFYTTQPHGLDPSRVEFDSPWLSSGPAAPAKAEAGTEVRAVGKLTALPGHADEVREMMRAVAEATRKEDGCLGYVLHTAKDDPDTVVVYESWASPAALDAHHKSPHMAAFAKAVSPIVDWPPRAELLTPYE
jgi:quinol monooxygenase YgiN/catechol 2,3-dioxygenase-like lactoylglutathione lyase family enzyme